MRTSLNPFWPAYTGGVVPPAGSPPGSAGAAPRGGAAERGAAAQRGGVAPPAGPPGAGRRDPPRGGPGGTQPALPGAPAHPGVTKTEFLHFSLL